MLRQIQACSHVTSDTTAEALYEGSDETHYLGTWYGISQAILTFFLS